MIRNIFRSIARFKSSAILNILGLSVAFTSFILIFMQVRHDITYDTQYKNHESIFYMSRRDTVSAKSLNWFNRQIPIQMKENIPSVEAVSIVGSAMDNNIVIVGENGVADYGYTYGIKTCEPDLLNIFSFEFVEGDSNALDNFDNIILSQSVAKQIFPEGGAIGRKIRHSGSVLSVAAIYKDFPKNSYMHTNGGAFRNIGNENKDRPNNHNYNLFAKFSNGMSTEEVNRIVTKFYDTQEYYEGKSILSDAVNISQHRVYHGHNTQFVYILMSVAVLILLIASINFINFATSLVPLKIRGINLKKVVGATRSEIITETIMEAVVLSVISLVLAFGMVSLFKNSSMSHVISDMDFMTNINVYILAVFVAIITGALSGLYPAIYSTSFAPALVLKSGFAMTTKGKRNRVLLLLFQYIVSFVLISSTLFMQRQYNYMMTFDGGYTKENILHVTQLLRDDSKYIAIKDGLRDHAQVVDIANCYTPFGSGNGGMAWGRRYSKGSFNVLSIPVSYNFLDFFEIKIDSGRNFVINDELSENGYFIMNKAAMDKYEFIPGEQINGHREATEIIGVCGDIKLTNLKNFTTPFCFFVFGKNPWMNLPEFYIKYNGDAAPVIQHIRDVFKRVEPTASIDIDFFDKEFEKAYRAESQIQILFTLFSVLTIIIALMGVYGLVSFDNSYRRREIGIRKVNGATVGNILSMFSLSYLKIVIISFAVSVPIAYYGISKWLESYPYKTELSWWVFVLSLLIVLTLTVLVTVAKSLRSATENPINAIKSN